KQTMDGDAYKAYKGRQKDADMGYISGVYGQIIGFGDKGLLIRSLEALKDTDKVITLGSIQNITDQFLGIKPNETVELLKGITGKEISEITTEDLGQALEKLKATENK
ncbi:MAG: hypothetical protein KAS78_05910, partial [Candidatus Pacebacteria bacterium]|nr:hypothetical protein [Candidatus Paceibacterota bacterium]